MLAVTSVYICIDLVLILLPLVGKVINNVDEVSSNTTYIKLLVLMMKSTAVGRNCGKEIVESQNTLL